MKVKKDPHEPFNIRRYVNGAGVRRAFGLNMMQDPILFFGADWRRKRDRYSCYVDLMYGKPGAKKSFVRLAEFTAADTAEAMRLLDAATAAALAL